MATEQFFGPHGKSESHVPSVWPNRPSYQENWRVGRQARTAALAESSSRTVRLPPSDKPSAVVSYEFTALLAQPFEQTEQGHHTNAKKQHEVITIART